MTTDPTTLAAQIEARLTEDGAAAAAAALCAEIKDGRWFDEEDEITDGDGLRLATINSFAVTTHIARNDPARVLRRVAVTRELVAAILAEPHDWNPGDEFYSCSQAIDPYGLNHDDREPGSACTDPDRAGKPCDCGRDQRVARLLGIIASAWEDK